MGNEEYKGNIRNYKIVTYYNDHRQSKKYVGEGKNGIAEGKGYYIMKMETKNMKEIGKIINMMLKEYYIMKMKIKDMKEILKMVDGKEKVYHIMKMEIKNMTEILKMVNIMEKE